MAKQPIGTFVVWDYVVMALVLAVSAGIGIYYGCTGGKQKTTKEFLMADHSMSILPVALSLLASFMSAITLLGTPMEIYVYGTQYWMIWVAYVLMMPFAAHVCLPIFFRLRITSVNEYLELRFCKGLRVISALLYIFMMAVYMALVLYAPSLALNQVTGLNKWISVFSIGLVCIFYTALGGMKAVLWTDAFQILMMLAGLIAVLIQGSIDQGGFSNIWRINYEGKRLEFFNVDPSPFTRHTLWSVVLGGTFTWVSIYGINQAQIQRALCCPTLKKAKIAMWINVPGLILVLTICSMCGMVIYAQYAHCDPRGNEDISSYDQILPLYVMHRLSVAPGLPGLFIACIFSGALSTISSGLNALAAITLQDLLRGLCFTKMADSRAALISKILAIVFGIVMLALSFVVDRLGGVLQAALALGAMIGGPVLGIFILGILYPCTNKWGAYAGLLCGLLISFLHGIGGTLYRPCTPRAPTNVTGCPVDIFNMTTTTTTTTPAITTSALWMSTEQPVDPCIRTGLHRFFAISYMWIAPISIGVTHFVGLLVSAFTGCNQSKVDPRLICPLFDVFCWCCPEPLLRVLRCNVNNGQKYITEYDDDTKEKDQQMDAKTDVHDEKKMSMYPHGRYVKRNDDSMAEKGIVRAYSNGGIQYDTPHTDVVYPGGDEVKSDTATHPRSEGVAYITTDHGGGRDVYIDSHDGERVTYPVRDGPESPVYHRTNEMTGHINQAYNSDHCSSPTTY